ncbi:non-ribosomal peptide synthetase [Puia dinghuensis]|uniref:Carrier domain-containing protein n=1 Tax=Puia dinghuensis TaxID=1792502 RepID=A0A8J2XPL4_9BACT|nr:non-ribosomal peptide synthetase [Puia dinghuensis]GGA81075.1 hypothetical protein GCM10011511_00050 [Puia dinghuensis]
MSNEKYVFPMSLAQKSLWLFESANPDIPGSPYNSVFSLSFTGRLNSSILKDSITAIFKRHEALRTTFKKENDSYLQVIHAQPNFQFEEKPWKEEKVEEFVHARVQQPFDLVNGPLARFDLLKIDAHRYILVVTIHHIIFDGWSVGIFVKELSRFYKAYPDYQVAALDSLAIQYPDYSMWKERYQKEHQEEELKYWKEKLEDANLYVDFPFDKPREKKNTYRGNSLRFNFSQQLLDEARHFCDQYSFTRFSLFYAIYAILLSKYSHQKDLVLTVPLAGREDRQELEQLIGAFVNMLPVRIDIDENETFLSLMSRINHKMSEILDHQQIDIATLQENLGFKQDVANASLFNFAFSYINVDFGDLTLDQVKIEYIHFERNTSRRDFTFYIHENKHTLFGEVEYFTDLLFPETVKTFIKNYSGLLTEALKVPQQKIRNVSFLDAQEISRQLYDFNNTISAYPSDMSIIDLFEKQVLRNPSRPAVWQNASPVTYEALNSIAEAHAALLQGHEKEAGDIIPVIAANPFSMIVGILAVLKTGRAYMPVDPNFPPERLSLMIDDSGSGIVLQETGITLPDKLSPRTIPIKNDIRLKPETPREKKRLTSGNDLCYVMYTSGSTGKPKGVKIKHRAVSRLVLNTNYLSIQADDRILQTAAMTFDASTLEIWGALLNGAGLYLSKKEQILNASSLRKELQLMEITILWLTAPLFSEMAAIDPSMFNNLRYLVVGGDVMAIDKTNAVQRTCPRLTIINGYGPTENTTFSTAYKIQQEHSGAIPIGKPISNSTVYILDDYQCLVPIGSIGTLFVGGDGLSSGYLNDSVLTDQKFIKNPFDPSQNIYNTGDLAKWLPDGNVEFLGRKDRQVKINGFRVEPGEVENVLNTYPGIRASFVKVGLQSIDAYIVKEDKTLAAGDIRTYLSRHLLPVMVPDKIIELDSLPLTPNGKIDVNALPKAATPRKDNTGKNPDVLENTLISMWAKTLGTEEEAIGVDDSFFEIGGHSLLATQLIADIEKEFKLELDLGDFFENDTIRFLAKLITEKEPSPVNEAIPQVPNQKFYEISNGQKRFWVLDQIKEGKGVYTITWSMKITGDFRSDALQYAIMRLVERHEILRTRFEYFNDTIYQRIADKIDPEQLLYFSRWESANETFGTIEQYLDNIAEQPFDLAKGPLLKIHVLRLSDRQFMLSAVLHHIITDEWSNKVFIREFSLLYDSFVKGTPITLDPLRIQYKDYTVWYKERLAEKHTHSRQFWLERLAGTLPKNEFPYKKGIRPATKTFNAHTIDIDLPEELYDNLTRLTKEENVTLFIVLLSALQLLASKYSGEDDILIGAPVSGRDHFELKDQLGFYANTVVFRQGINHRLHYKEFLADVKRNTIETLKYSDYPFDNLVEDLGLRNDLSRAPIFELFLGLLDMNDQTADSLSRSGDLRFDPYPTVVKKSPFDLVFNARKDDKKLNIELYYNTDLFDTWIGRQLLDEYIHLLQQISANPSIGLTDLEFPSATALVNNQRKHVHAETRPVNQSIIEVFSAQAAIYAREPAIVYGNNTISYGDLLLIANKWSHILAHQYNIRKGETVALLFKEAHLAIVGMLGLLKLGAVYLPLNADDPVDRIDHMIRDSGVSHVLTDHQDPETFGHLSATFIPCTDLPDPAPELPIIDNSSPEDPAYILYTSGSTGLPKGAKIRHRSVVNLLKHSNYNNLGPGNNILQFSPIFFDVSVFEIFGALLNGARLTTIDMSNQLTVPDLAFFIESQNIDTAVMTASRFNNLVENAPLTIACFERLYFGGEPPSINMVRTALKYRKNEDSIGQLYGPTEATVFTTYYPVTTIPNDAINLPIGLPISGTSVFILDKDLKPAPRGVQGEIFIGGLGVAQGYVGNPELNKEKFIENPFVEGDILYKSGDIGRWNQTGEIEFLGRNDDQVKIRGQRIELGEIETTILKCPEIYETKVLASMTTANTLALTAYWTGQPSYQNVDLNKHLIESLPRYMVPSSLRKIESFPLNSNGKIDVRMLRQLSNEEIDLIAQAPATQTEIELMNIWHQHLGSEKITADSNFFEIGGHSLTAMKVSSVIFDQMGVTIPLKDIYLYPTIREMGGYIDSSRWLAKQGVNDRADRTNDILI